MRISVVEIRIGAGRLSGRSVDLTFSSLVTYALYLLCDVVGINVPYEETRYCMYVCVPSDFTCQIAHY